MIAYHAVQTLITKVVRGRYFCMCNHQYWVGVSSQNRYGHGCSGRSVSYGPVSKFGYHKSQMGPSLM